MRLPKRIASLVVITTVGLFAAPASAQQPNAFPITNVNLRAGPGTQYPVILTVPADAPITILGCLPDYTWCDSVFENYRGWMSAVYLSGYYEGDYYLLRDYAPDLGYQPVTFNIDAYWDSYYRDEPFYGERGRWERPYDEGYVDEAVFYDRLSPHGSWTWIQGRYVWVPSRVERDWRPYTRGRWVYTDRGWTWVSNEPFGWATYHYGRWGFSDRVGWFWVPGNRWAPAWVSWRQSDDYLAWAPLPPSYDGGYERGYDRGGGISINISFGDVPDYYWSMVPSRDFLSDDLPRYYVHDRGRRRSAFDRTRPVGHTTIVNKTVVNNVVNVNYVEQKTKKKVVKRRIARTENVEAAGKVEDDTLEVYEPKPGETPEAVAPPEPKDVETVAETSETKGQAEGEATTEDMLAPKEVQEAVKERKGGKGRKAKTDAQAEAKDDDGLPEGEIADAPPPAKDTAKEKPVPAHEVAAPKAKEAAPEEAAPEEPAPAAKQEAPKTEPKETKETPKTKEPETSPEKERATETPEPGTSKPDTSKPERGTKEKPAAPEPKSEGQPKKEKPSEKKPGPAGKAPEAAETKDETPPAPKEEMSPKEEKPAEVRKPEPPAEPEAKKPEPKKPEPKEAPADAKPAPEEKPEAKTQERLEPEVKAPEAKTSEPKVPQAKKTQPEPKAKKPEPKKPEAKKPAPTPEAKKPAPKPEAKKPAPKPEAKKPEAKKPAPKPEAKKPAPKPEAKKPGPKPQAKKPAPKKQEARRPEPKPQAKKPEAKKPAAAKQKDRTAQAPDAKGKAPAKGKKKDGKSKE